MKNLPPPLKKLFSETAVAIIGAYQQVLSPDHGILTLFWGKNRCRFYPSCSEYTAQALRQYGLFQGIVVSLKRILRCHPWSQGGHDPVKYQKLKTEEQKHKPDIKK